MILSDWLYGVLVGITWVAWVLWGTWFRVSSALRPPAGEPVESPALQVDARSHPSRSPGLWAGAAYGRAPRLADGWIAARYSGAAGLTPVS